MLYHRTTTIAKRQVDVKRVRRPVIIFSYPSKGGIHRAGEKRVILAYGRRRTMWSRGSLNSLYIYYRLYVIYSFYVCVNTKTITHGSTRTPHTAQSNCFKVKPEENAPSRIVHSQHTSSDAYWLFELRGVDGWDDTMYGNRRAQCGAIVWLYDDDLTNLLRVVQQVITFWAKPRHIGFLFIYIEVGGPRNAREKLALRAHTVDMYGYKTTRWLNL